MNFYDFEYWPYDKYGTREEKLWNLSQVPRDWAEEDPMKVCVYPYYDAREVNWYRIELDAEDQYNAIFAIQKLLDDVIGTPLRVLAQYQITFSEDSEDDEITKTWEMKELGDVPLPGGRLNIVYMDKLNYAVNIRNFDPYQAFLHGMDLLEESLREQK